MNNEENKINEAQPEAIEAEKKGLSKGALIGIIAGAAVVVIAIVVAIILLAGGNKCKDHVDADDDYLCDNCGEHFDDGDEGNDDSSVKMSTVKFTVKLDSGAIIPNVEFTLKGKSNEYTLKAGDDGSVTADIIPASYQIIFVENALPENCIQDVFGVKIADDTKTVEITVIDNTPDGTAKKPFYLSENETEISIAAGQEVYYFIHNAQECFIRINNDNAVISYDGKDYVAENGVAEIYFAPSADDNQYGEVKVTVFSVKNVGDTDFSTTLIREARLGSAGNPIELDSNTCSAFVSEGKAIYYKWIADKNGVLSIASEDAKSSISVKRVLENDVPIIAGIEGGGVTYLQVAAGDEIVFSLSAKDTAVAVEITFAFEIFVGDAENPVPVMNGISISLGAGESVSLVALENKSFSIKNSEAVVVYNGTEYTPDANGEIAFTVMANDVFEIINKAEIRQDIIVK